MEIRRAVYNDLAAVDASYTELLRDIRPEENYSGWVLGVYPTWAWAEENLEDLWVLTENGQLGASMILNHQQAEDYAKVPWEISAPPEKVFVIHTLCVPPSQAGRGYGRAMVKFAVEEARRQGMAALRIDTAETNKPAAALYQGCGFQYRGSLQVLHQGLIPEKLIFLELGLSKP